MQKITPFLWFSDQAEEAANFYVSVFKNSKIEDVFRTGGKVLTVGFQLDGQHFTALNGGPMYPQTPAASIAVLVDDQTELDRLWSALTADGGKAVQCGWLTDKFGVSWQIVPEALIRLLRDPDPAIARRVMQAMLTMVKLDIAGLETAARG